MMCGEEGLGAEGVEDEEENDEAVGGEGEVEVELGVVVAHGDWWDGRVSGRSRVAVSR